MEGQERKRKTFLDTIHEAVDYVGYHFSTEEKVMARINYPDYARHKQEHAAFVREVFRKMEEYNTGKITAPITFVYFLRDWILHHIAVSDRKMGEFLMLMKRNGELDKITLKVKKDEATDRMQIR